MHNSYAKAIVECGVEKGLPLTLHESYSGRMMFGRTTSGVVGPLQDILRAMLFAVHESEDGYDLASQVDLRMDQMGKSDWIVY